jgi:hypothetical protein
VFANRAELGSFGEFVYQRFVKSLGLQISKEAILESDFLVDKRFYVDVKTTQTNKAKYDGLRVRDNISYDLIVVFNGNVKIFPDKSSPLINHHGVLLGELNSLVEEWQKNRHLTQRSPNTNPHKDKRLAIKGAILEQFPLTKKKRVRIIFRGSVSETRWSSSPDNIPGSVETIAKYDLTVFTQMITVGDVESIRKIYVFPHNSLSKVPMKAPDKRQLQKGIVNVVDFKAYAESFSHLIFSNLDGLIRWIRENKE